jgi:sugar phosphate isomerase/epimerase
VKLGVLTAPFDDLPLEEVLASLAGLGVEAVELGTGNYPGSAHCDLDDLLVDAGSRRRLRRLLDSHGLFISALSQHGNPLHPQAPIARGAHETWRKTVELASALNIPVVNAFSGCPGDSPGSLWPNWAVCSWPEDYLRVLEWQWLERVIPYWQTEEAFARQHGVKIGIEMHAGFVVYNPETLLRLRRATGSNLGANFDPSHLFWQGIDAVEAISILASEECIFHVHAKDTQLRDDVIRRKGVLDTEPHERVGERAWSFRTLGFGHDEKTWRDILSRLQLGGYDYVVSIEHEDELLATDDAIAKAIAFLDGVLPRSRGEGALPMRRVDASNSNGKPEIKEEVL